MITIPPLSELQHWSHQELVALLWTVLNDTHFESLADQVAIVTDRLLLSDQTPPDSELVQQITEDVRALEAAAEPLVDLYRNTYMTDDFVMFASGAPRESITNIRMYLALLNKRPQYKLVLQEHTRRLQSHTRQVMQLARLALGTAELPVMPIALNRLVSTVVAHHQPKALDCQAALDLELSSEVGLAWLNVELITQALDNILANGLHATPRGGNLVCRTARLWYAERSWLLIHFNYGETPQTSDHPYLRRCFYRHDELSRQRPQCSNFDLAVALEIIMCHGGHLTVDDDDPQQGRGFTLWLRPVESGLF